MRLLNSLFKQDTPHVQVENGLKFFESNFG